MKISILKIILWPKDQDQIPRVIPLSPGKINIITGESETGKSAITSIIDYCLGSDKCAIPVGFIRNMVSWFGLHIQLNDSEMLIARRNPESQQSTTDLFWIEGSSLVVPPVVEKNSRVDDLKNRFNQLANLASLDLSPEANVGFGTRPSFRDMAAFNFQPQHIVANPYTFFFKADTTEHREKLKMVFPLVLNAIDSAALAKQRELKDLERELEKLTREYETRLAASVTWESEIQGYYLQALSLGLIPNSPTPDSSWPIEKYIRELQPLPESIRNSDLPDVKEGSSEVGVHELNTLILEEDSLSQEIAAKRQRLAKIGLLSKSVEDYGLGVVHQEDRLVTLGWLEEKLADEAKCPFCGSSHEKSNPHLVELQKVAAEFKNLSKSITQAPAILDSEIAELRLELRDLEGSISKIRQKRHMIEEQTTELKNQRQRVRQIYLFVGRIEQAIANIQSGKIVGDLRTRIQSLQLQISGLRADLDPRKLRERLEAAIDKVSRRIERYAGVLQLEHSTENVQLDIKELSLRFNNAQGRKDYIWEIGSGQNWVGYHIAGILALHGFFLGQPNSPVPNFLIIDQPSQVYFPEAWPSLKKVPISDSKKTSSADIAGVKRIFSILSSFLDEVKEDFQFIVTEHAGSITWDGVKNVNLVGNWREGFDDFLIPKSWYVATIRGIVETESPNDE